MFPRVSGVPEPTVDPAVMRALQIINLETAQKINELITTFAPEKTVFDYAPALPNLDIVLGLNPKIGNIITVLADTTAISGFKDTIRAYNLSKIITVASVSDQVLEWSNRVVVLYRPILRDETFNKLMNASLPAALIIVVSKTPPVIPEALVPFYEQVRFEKEGVSVYKPYVWERHVLEYVEGELKKILADPKDPSNKIRDSVIVKMLNPDHHGVWFNAFTHPSFDFRNNYETLEIFGDKMLAPAFVNYLRSKPEYQILLTEGFLTKLLSFYAAKAFQAKLADDLQLSRFVRYDTNFAKNVSMKEDVLEAFIGALFTVADRVQIGLGELAVFNYITLLFSNIPITLEEGYNARSELTERYRNFRQDLNPGYVFGKKDKDPQEGKYPYTQVMGRGGWQTVIYKDFKHSLVIGQNSGGSEKKSLEMAAREALKWMDSRGYSQIASDERKVRNIYKINDTDVKLITERIGRLGYPHFRFVMKSGTESGSSSSNVSSARKAGMPVHYMARLRAYHGVVTDPRFVDVSMGMGDSEETAVHQAIVKFLRQ